MRYMIDKKQGMFKTRFKKYSKYLFLFLALLFLISLGKNVARIFQAQKRIDDARRRVAKLEEENRELQDKLAAAESETFTEKQIREKLGLAKEGETVVVLPDTETIKRLAPKIEAEEDVLPDPIWKRWLHLFY